MAPEQRRSTSSEGGQPEGDATASDPEEGVPGSPEGRWLGRAVVDRIVDVGGELGELGRPVLRPQERLLRHNDELGVFVPLTALDVDDVPALKARLAVLEREVVRLQGERAELSEIVDDLRSPRSPDDFATAVSRAVDSLAARMATMSNPTSDFAVREFTVEAQVAIDVNRLGQLEYRFPLPHEQIDPRQLSTVSLRVVPIPREQDPEEPDPSRPTGLPFAEPDIGVEEVFGIGQEFRRRLAAHGVHTVRDLLAVGVRARTALELQALLGVERAELVGWLRQAELVTLPSLDGRTAFVLLDAGFSGLAALAETDPAEVVRRYAESAARLAPGLGPIRPVDRDVVRVWQEAARSSRLVDRLPS